MCKTLSPVRIHGRDVNSWMPCLLPYVQEILRPALPTTSEFPVFSLGSKQGDSELWNREGITVSRSVCKWEGEKGGERAACVSEKQCAMLVVSGLVTAVVLLCSFLIFLYIYIQIVEVLFYSNCSKCLQSMHMYSMRTFQLVWIVYGCVCVCRLALSGVCFHSMVHDCQGVTKDTDKHTHSGMDTQRESWTSVATLS